LSTIQELLEALCPQGIELKPLKALCSDFIVPMRDRPKEFSGTIDWCRIEDIEGVTLNGSLSNLQVSQQTIIDMKLKVMPVGTVIASCSASLGRYAITTKPLITNQTFIGLVCGPQILNRFLLHLLPMKTNELIASSNSGTIPYISRQKFENLRVPCPPLEVQHAIVEILDKFYELEAELVAELEARTKQLVYYRSQLLNLDHKVVERNKIGALVSVVRAKKIIPRSSYETTGKFPIIDQGQAFIAGWTQDESAILPSGNYVVFGDHTRSIKYVDFPFAQGADGLQILKAAEGVNPRYLFHAMSSLELPNRGYNRHWTLVRDIEIPLPNLETQFSIASKLDEFDSLVNDLSFGIPAEIAARRKQYEHYRDQLLTFKEA
jgi:type I restriction enzyme S subunit